MLTEEFYNQKLQEYFDERYSKYGDEIEWYVNPAINTWKFYIPSIDLNVELTYNDNDSITVYQH